MKIVHLSDLHLGKKVNEFSMIDDQKYILDQILDNIKAVSPQAVIIAGDVYDKPIPPVEAVTLLNDFLLKLASLDIKVFVLSGNHDSSERLAFGSGLIEKSGIYISPTYSGKISPITLTDRYGDVNFYMLPFIKPVNVRKFFPECEINTYTEAVQIAIEAMDINTEKRNVLIAHQFVTGAARSESEELTIGGSDNVESEVFTMFDYTALGHIHRPQKAGAENIRYSGTPLKYSFSEANQQKIMLVIELKEKGITDITPVPLTPIRDMRAIKGTYEELSLRENYEGTNTEDYLQVTLTDEEDVPNALGKLRSIYPNIMKLDYDNSRTRTQSYIFRAREQEKKTGLELFEELFKKQNGCDMNGEQKEYAARIFEALKEREA